MTHAEPAPSGTCTIVVPCYNEADRLNTAEFRAYISQSPGKCFLFVNDGSRDRTVDVLKHLQAELPAQVDILDKPQNAGKGEAVRDGLIHALGDPNTAYIGFWDADLSTPLAGIHDLLSILVLNPQVDIVLGSRVKLLGRDIQRQPMRHYLGRVFATAAAVVLNLPVYDTQCGAKLFRVTPHLRELLDQPFCSRWIFDVELLARFLQLQSRLGKDPRDTIYEFPLHCWRDVPGSKLRPRDFIRAIRDLLVIRKRYGASLRAVKGSA